MPKCPIAEDRCLLEIIHAASKPQLTCRRDDERRYDECCHAGFHPIDSNENFAKLIESAKVKPVINSN